MSSEQENETNLLLDFPSLPTEIKVCVAHIIGAYFYALPNAVYSYFCNGTL